MDLLKQFFSAKERYKALISERERGLPRVRIESPKPQARRRSINRTRTSQEHKINITSGNNAYIPELYGPCSPKPHMFAVGMDGNDLIFGLWYGFGEIEEFTEILINDVAVPGAVTVEEHKGTSTQTASTILSNLSGYTDTLVIDVNGTDRGVAYLAFRIPPGAVDGFPKVTVKLKGNCEIEDTRGPTTAYSDLPALCFRHWLKTTGVGPEFSVNDSTFETLATFNEEVPGDAWQASYNYSAGDFATPTGTNTKFRIYEVTTDNGSSGGTEPVTWNDTLGATTNDGDLVWTCRDGRRHVCGMVMDVKADVDSWIETWRTACGGMVHFGESGVEVIPDKTRATDHTFLHASGEILESPALQLRQTRLKDRVTSVHVVYTNTSGEPWRDATVRVAAAGVDAGTTPDRLSVIYAPWIQRKAQAVRLATERLNASSLTDLGFSLSIFDEGLKVMAGDVVEVTHPIGLSAKKMRVLDAYAMAPGRWTLDLWEYDPAVYSDHVESEPTYDNFGLNTAQAIPRIFIVTPTTPYKVGDIWVGGPSGDIKRCSTARTSGAYQAGDWELASDYTEGAVWGSNITDQPTDALLLNELNCVGGYQEVSLPNETGSLNRVDCYINNNIGTTQWFKVAEFDLTGNHKTCTWNGLFNYGSSNGRYDSQMRVRINAQTDGAGALTNLGYKYSGDDKTARLRVAYSGVVVTVYVYLGANGSCLFDGAWSANVVAGNSWIHTAQDNTDNIGTGTPAGTFLTPTKNYTQGADITGDNTSDNASNYTGNSIATGYTAAKCTDATADKTSTHTANNTTYINGSLNETGDVQIEDDLKIMNTDISFYSSSTHKGGIYAVSDGLLISAIGNLKLASTNTIVCNTDLRPNSTQDCGSATYPWTKVYSNAYYASGGAQGITQTETGVSTFDITITDGLITHFYKSA